MSQAKNTYLIGFSGGADSTAALLWALENLQDEALDILAVHFNHHLRGSESDAEAENAAAFAAGRGVKFRLTDIFVPPGSNLESRARRARLEAWKQLCREYENPVVVTGHHQDDCIENMFIRIGRGSNVSGLTGLQTYSEVEGVKFFRPLLDMSRTEIEDFLRSKGVTSWAVDSSNLQCDYSRNMLRNKILPSLYDIFPGGRKPVLQTLKCLRDDAACLDRMAHTFFTCPAKDHCEVGFWQEHIREPALIVRMLRMLCREFFGENTPLTAAFAERFAAMISAGKNGRAVLDEKRTLVISGGRITFDRETPAAVRWQWKISPETSWDNYVFKAEKVDRIPEKVSPAEAFFDAGTLPDILTLSAAESGDEMIPFGRTAAVKVKKLRIDRKIPAFPVLPLLRGDDKKVLWMAFVRHSAHYPARPGREIVRIFAEKAE